MAMEISQYDITNVSKYFFETKIKQVPYFTRNKLKRKNNNSPLEVTLLTHSENKCILVK